MGPGIGSPGLIDSRKSSPPLGPRPWVSTALPRSAHIDLLRFLRFHPVPTTAPKSQMCGRKSTSTTPHGSSDIPSLTTAQRHAFFGSLGRCRRKDLEGPLCNMCPMNCTPPKRAPSNSPGEPASNTTLESVIRPPFCHTALRSGHALGTPTRGVPDTRMHLALYGLRALGLLESTDPKHTHQHATRHTAHTHTHTFSLEISAIASNIQGKPSSEGGARAAAPSVRETCCQRGGGHTHTQIHTTHHRKRHNRTHPHTFSKISKCMHVREICDGAGRRAPEAKRRAGSHDDRRRTQGGTRATPQRTTQTTQPYARAQKTTNTPKVRA